MRCKFKQGQINRFLVWFFSSVCAWRCTQFCYQSCSGTSWAEGGSVSASSQACASSAVSCSLPCGRKYYNQYIPNNIYNPSICTPNIRIASKPSRVGAQVGLKMEGRSWLVLNSSYCRRAALKWGWYLTFCCESLRKRISCRHSLVSGEVCNSQISACICRICSSLPHSTYQLRQYTSTFILPPQTISSESPAEGRVDWQRAAGAAIYAEWGLVEGCLDSRGVRGSASPCFLGEKRGALSYSSISFLLSASASYYYKSHQSIFSLALHSPHVSIRFHAPNSFPPLLAYPSSCFVVCLQWSAFLFNNIMMRLLTNSLRRFSTTNFLQIAGFDSDTAALQATVRRFAEERIAPLAQKVDKEDNFPEHLWKQFGDMGLLGSTVPAQYGGSELSYTAHSMIMEEISRASGSIGLSYGAHTALCLGQIARHGTEAQKQKYLPKLCSGQWVGALAMSEPGAGSDVTSMKLRAEKRGNKYVLNGSKMWITNGPNADVIVVYAKTNPELKDKGITCFLVEKNYKGFSVAQKLDKLGMRGSNTGELVFENVEVPQENVLGEINKGVYVLMSGLDYERLVLAAGPVGIMQSAFEITQDYMKTRTQFGKPIGHFQLMQGKIAEMYTKLQASRAMLYSCSRMVDAGHLTNLDCASVIYFASKCGTEVALEAIQALGGNGYINEYPTGRLLRDAKLYEIGAGTQQIRLWLMGRQLLK